MRPSSIYLASKRAAVTYVRNSVTGSLDVQVAPGGTGNVVADMASYLNVSWISSAMTDEDREAAAANPDGISLRFTSDNPIQVYLLQHDRRVFDSMQNVLTADVIWASNNYLWDSWTAPTFDASMHGVWEDFKVFTADFANELLTRSATDPDAVYLVHDYQLVCVPAILRKARPDRPILNFIHIPWPSADYWRMLPRYIRTEILRGMLGATVIGFFADRWVRNFLASVEDCLPESKVNWSQRTVEWDGRTVQVADMPLGYSPQALEFRSPRIDPELERWWGDRPLVLHSGRTDPMKNGERAVQAFVTALTRDPSLRGTRLLVRSNPNRLYVEANHRYFERLTAAVAEANQTLGEEAVRLICENDVDATIGCMRRADVLFINSTVDGQNLTIFEGALMTPRDAWLILSERCGAAEALHEVCTMINPFDIDEQAEALRAALHAGPEERAAAAARRREVAARYDLPSWADQQLRSLGIKPPSR